MMYRFVHHAAQCKTQSGLLSCSYNLKISATETMFKEKHANTTPRFWCVKAFKGLDPPNDAASFLHAFLLCFTVYRRRERPKR